MATCGHSTQSGGEQKETADLNLRKKLHGEKYLSSDSEIYRIDCIEAQYW